MIFSPLMIAVIKVVFGIAAVFLSLALFILIILVALQIKDIAKELWEDIRGTN